jgi:hypothetical protein
MQTQACYARNFNGDDFEFYKLAADLSLAVNFEMHDKPLKKLLFISTRANLKAHGLGNKVLTERNGNCG